VCWRHLTDMSKFLSGRQSELKVGISSYTESKTVLEITGKVGIGTTNATSKLHVIGDVRVSGVVTATTFSGTLDGIVTKPFPTGDYGDLSTGTNDSFGQLISSATLYDFLDTPSGSLKIEDFGVLT
jgi:hypothetical protein